LTGSTRMKSGTAQKMVLNMITTTAMIRLGKVYNNYMIDLMPLNTKLVNRSIKMISEISGCSTQEVKKVFEKAGRDTRICIVMLCLDVDAAQAKELLSLSGGSINKVLDGRRCI